MSDTKRSPGLVLLVLLLVFGGVLLVGQFRSGGAVPLPRPLVDANVAGWLNTEEPLDDGDLEGRWVLVDLWATWCGPCVQGLPELADFHRRHPEIALVGVADDHSSINQINDLMSQIDGFDWPVAYGGTAAHYEYDIPGIPTLVLYNPAGEEVARAHSLVEIEMALMKHEQP